MANKVQKRNLSVNEASDIIFKILKTNIVPFLWGPPGIGKSSLVRKIATKAGLELIDLRLSLLNPVDLRGLPHVNKDTHVAEWLPPSFMPKFNTKTKGILFLDEINLAPMSVQAAAYQLILDKQLGEYKFPPTWRIIAAGNRETDQANVYKLPAPLANRFVHLEIHQDLDSWKNWARGRLLPEVVTYVSQRAEYLFKMPSNGEKAFPTPRTWEFVSNLMEAFNYDSNQSMSQDLQDAIMSAVGEAVGGEFISTLEILREEGIGNKVDEFIKTGKLTMPKELDLRFAVITAMWDAAKSNKVTPAQFEKFLENHVNEEERATIQAVEKEYKDKITKRFSGPIPDPKTTSVLIEKDIHETVEKIPVSSTKPFKNKKKPLLIYDAEGNKELIEWDGFGGGNIHVTSRGAQGTEARDWKKGSLVQEFQGDWK